MASKGQLKFNLSFKKSEIELYKIAVEDQRCPGSFIKDAIEFYIKFRNNEIKVKDNTETAKEEEEVPNVESNDLLNF